MTPINMVRALYEKGVTITGRTVRFDLANEREAEIIKVIALAAIAESLDRIATAMGRQDGADR